MRKKLIIILTVMLLVVVLVSGALMLTACGNGVVGYWQITEVTAGDVVMTNEDANTLGLATVGAIKLQKSGKCVVTLLGEETEGIWTQTEDGALTVNYGDDMVLSGSINDEGVMVLTDTQGSEYKLEK